MKNLEPRGLKNKGLEFKSLNLGTVAASKFKKFVPPWSCKLEVLNSHSQAEIQSKTLNCNHEFKVTFHSQNTPSPFAENVHTTLYPNDYVLQWQHGSSHPVLGHVY